MLSASAASLGFPMMAPSSATVVSAASTSAGLSSYVHTTAWALAWLRRSTIASGDSPAMGVSSTSAVCTTNGMGRYERISRRRGDDDARTSCMLVILTYATMARDDPGGPLEGVADGFAAADAAGGDRARAGGHRAGRFARQIPAAAICCHAGGVAALADWRELRQRRF